MGVREKVVSLVLTLKDKLTPDSDKAAGSLKGLQGRVETLRGELNSLEKSQGAFAGLERASYEAKQAEKAFLSAENEIKELKAAMRTGKSPELVVALENARGASRAAKQELKQSIRAVADYEAQISKAGFTVRDGAKAQKDFAAKTDYLNGRLKAAEGQLKSARGAVGAAGDAAGVAGGQFKTAARSMVAMAGGLFAVSKVKDGLEGVAAGALRAGDEFERLGLRLSAGELGFVEEFTRSTPLQLQDTTAAFMRLRTFGLDPMDGSMQALVDQSEALGGGQEKLLGIVDAVGQAWAKGKLQQEEVLQLIERGVPVWDLLAKSTGKNAQELQALATAGKLGRAEITQLVQAMGEATAGTAAAQMGTLSGLWSNLQDTWTQFLRRVADAGVLDYAKAQLRALSDEVQGLIQSGRFDEFAKKMSDGLVAGAEAVKGFILTLRDMSGALAAIGQAWLGLRLANMLQGIASLRAGFAATKNEAGGAAGAVTALGAALRAAGWALVVNQLARVAGLYQDLKVAVAEQAMAEDAAARSSAELAFKLRDISEATGVSVTSMAELSAALEDGRLKTDELAGGYYSTAQYAELLADRNRALAQQSAVLAVDAGALSAAMRATRETLKGAADDSRKLGSVLESALVESLAAGAEGAGGFVLALRQLQAEGAHTGDELQKGLLTALGQLSDKQRGQFGEYLRAELEKVKAGGDSAGLSVKYLESALASLNAAGQESALGRLGVDAAQLSGGLSKGFKQASEDLTVLKTSLQSTAGTARDVGQAVFTALSGALSQVKTEADKKEFNKALNDFSAAGKLTAEQMQQLRDAVAGVGAVAQVEFAGATGAARDAAVAVEQVSDAASRSSAGVQAVAASLAGYFNGVKQEIAGLSAEALNAFNQRLGIDAQPVLDEIQSLRAGIDDARADFQAAGRDSLLVFDASGINRFENAVAQARATTVEAYNTQKIKYLEYMDALRSGEPVSAQLVTNAQAALSSMDLLGRQDLSQLRSALESAKNQLQSMNDAAQNTLANLQNELDQLQGNQVAIDRREYEQKKAELQAALDEARRYGNKQAVQYYTDALSVLEQVRREKQSQAAEKSTKKTSENSANYSSESAQSSAKKTTIVLQGVGGSSVELSGESGSVEKLLGVLKESSLRRS